MAESVQGKKNGGRAIAVNVRLKGGEQPHQPILANYTQVGLARALAYVDFGFLEPVILASLARRAQRGESLPVSLEGARVARMALPLESLIQLQQQLQQVLASLQSRSPKVS